MTTRSDDLRFGALVVGTILAEAVPIDIQAVTIELFAGVAELIVVAGEVAVP